MPQWWRWKGGVVEKEKNPTAGVFGGEEVSSFTGAKAALCLSR